MPTTYSFDNAWIEARDRLAALEARFDPGTVRHLDRIGVKSGWRCLEAGAGGGTIAAWLCSRVGPSGSVLAIDLDTRFVETLSEPNLTVKKHDITREALPVDEFDLVHARALLAHLPDRDSVLARIVAALRPGGWLLCEELDGLTIALLAPQDPVASTVYAKVEAAVAAAMARRGHDYEFGRRLPALFLAHGLVEVNGEGRTFLRRPGADALTARLTVEQLEDDMVQAGDVDRDDVRAYLKLLENPSFLAQTALMVAAWGRRPNGHQL